MDAQTQERLKVIVGAVEIGMADERIAKSNVLADLKFLLQLIYEQQTKLNEQDTYIANVNTMMPQYGLDEYIPDDKEEAYHEGYRVALVDVDSVLHGGVMP